MKKEGACPSLNREWHEEYRMPKNPTMEQRIAWHFAHARACVCRPILDSVLRAAKKINAHYRPTGIRENGTEKVVRLWSFDLSEDRG